MKISGVISRVTNILVPYSSDEMIKCSSIVCSYLNLEHKKLKRENEKVFTRTKDMAHINLTAILNRV
jgi:hypothetical protein